MNANNVVYLASYKGKGGFIDRAIRWVLKGQYSHSEIVITNSDPFNVDRYVLAITAAGTEGGVRMRNKQLNSDDWDLIKLPCVDAETALNWYRENAKESYDWFGVIRFMFPFAAPQHQNAWFCSEACATIIGFKDAWRYDPSTLHDAVLRLNHGR